MLHYTNNAPPHVKGNWQLLRFIRFSSERAEHNIDVNFFMFTFFIRIIYSLDSVSLMCVLFERREEREVKIILWIFIFLIDFILQDLTPQTN